MLMTAPQSAPTQTKRPRCIVFEPLDKIDTSTLAAFGDAVYLFDGGHRPSIFQGEQLGDAIAERFNAIGYDSNRDYLVITGTVNCIAHMVAVAVNRDGALKALLYSMNDKRYSVVELG